MAQSHCGGDCAGCSGCSGVLTVTREELDFLDRLAQTPFLPLARRRDSDKPVFLENGDPEKYENILLLLERKNLISLDYDIPLTGKYPEMYESYPIRGSIALTLRGQQVLELMEYQGVGGGEDDA